MPIPVLLKIRKVVAPIVRGLLKNSFPGIAAVADAIRNKTGVPVTITTATGEVVTGTTAPHDTWSIIAGLVGAGIMVYMWTTGALDKDQVDKLIDVLLGLIR